MRLPADGRIASYLHRAEVNKEMAVGLVEVGLLIVGSALLLWLLPKSLPQLGRAIRQFQDEIKRK